MATLEMLNKPWSCAAHHEVREDASSREHYSTQEYDTTEETRYTTRTETTQPVGGAPVFLSALQDCRVARGGEKTLEVVVGGQPSPTVSWFKDGVKIDDADVENVGNCYRLYIVDMEDADCGVYSVEATNSLGETKCYARLFIDDRDAESPSLTAPRLLRHFSDIEAKKGQNAVFEAVVVGNPKPSVHWLFNNEPIRNARYHFSNVDNKYTMVVSNVRREDFGRFALIAENIHGKVSCSASLFVEGEQAEHDMTNGFVTDSTRRSTSLAERESRYAGTHQDSAVHYRSSSKVADRFGETLIHGERTCQRPLGYVVRQSPADRTEGTTRRSHSQTSRRRVAASDEEFFGSDFSTEQVHETREVTKDITEKRYRERYVVSDDEFSGEEHARRHRRYKPVEFIVGKRGRYAGREGAEYEYHREAHAADRAATRHKLRQRKRRQIRLGSVPIGEHTRRVISDKSTQGYRSIDLIVGKPKIQKVVVQKQEESDSRIFSHVAAAEEHVELTIPKARHSSTVVKEKQREAGYSQITVGGDHERKILQEPVEVPAELELKIPKAQHSSTVYKEAKVADQILTVTEPTIISGQESVRIHDQPLRIEEEVSLKIGKSGGEHSSTVVREKKPEDQFISVGPSVIKGTHDLRIIEESISGFEETDVQIPKPETVPGGHSTTVMRETDIKKQVFNVDHVAAIPGERDERFMEKLVSAEESVQVKLPKAEERHTSTVVRHREEEQDMLDIEAVKMVPGEHEFRLMEVAPTETEVHLPKAGQHSSTLIREKGEKLDLGRIRSLSGEHMYKLIEDSQKEYSSTVMLEKKKDRKVYDISLASEVSEVEEDAIAGELHRRGHVVSWLSDVEKKQLAQQELGRHTTTIVKKQEDIESIEMLLPRPVDTSEIVAELNDYSEAQTIVLQRPETIIEKEIHHRDVKSEVVADVATRYAVVSEAAATVEQSSIQIDSVKQAEEHIGVQVSASSSEVVAELKSQLELKSDQIQAAESATSVSMDVGEKKDHPSVELRLPLPTIQSSRSIVVADVQPALKGPSEALMTQEPSSSEVVISPAQRGQVELSIRQPDIEASSSTVLADVAARLSAQGVIQKAVTVEPSSACVELDLRKKPRADVEVNIPGITVQESSTKIVAGLREKLTVHEESAKALSQPSSSSSISVTGAAERKRTVDIRMRNLRVDDSKAEVLVSLPGKTKTSLVSDVAQSSSSISIQAAKGPMEITMQAPEQEPSSSTLETRTKYYGLSTAEIRDFGQIRRPGADEEVELVLHEPQQRHTVSRLEDSRYFQSSHGSSTIIKDIGFSDDSYDRYYISDGEKSSSTMHVDVGTYDYGVTPTCPSPVFLRDLEDCAVTEGETLVLECHVRGADEVCWLKDHRIPGEHCNIQFIDRRIAKLTISEVFQEDSGLYTCSAYNRDANNQTSAYVTVIAQQPLLDGTGYMQSADSSSVCSYTPASVKSDVEMVSEQTFAREELTSTSIQQTMATEAFAEPPRPVDPFALFGARRGSRGSVSKAKKEEVELVSITKDLPPTLRKPEGSFMRLEVLTAGVVVRVEWKRDDIVLSSGSDCRIASKAPTHSLVIPNLRKEHSGRYVAVIIGPSNTVQSSVCTVEVTEAPRRFTSGNIATGPMIEEARSANRSISKESGSFSKASSTPSPGRVIERELEIHTRKDPKPETKITVKEASAENSVFVFSETEEGQFVSVDGNSKS